MACLEVTLGTGQILDAFVNVLDVVGEGEGIEGAVVTMRALFSLLVSLVVLPNVSSEVDPVGVLFIALITFKCP